MNAHLSTSSLVRLLGGESPKDEVILAQRHLLACRECRSRYRKLEDAGLSVIDYTRNLVALNSERSRKWRDLFILRLDQLWLEGPPTSWWKRFNAALSQRLRLPELALAPTMILTAVALAIFIFLAARQKAPHVTSTDLLNRAVLSDNKLKNTLEPGVVRQRIRIRTDSSSLERAIYADTKRIRRPRSQRTQRDEQRLSNHLATAGVSWEDPLSASAYRAWHDRQASARDKVDRQDNGLLTLTTTVSDGIVAQESVAFRQRDLHMIERTVQFRDLGTVEIAEIGYEILAWNETTDSLFEPLPSSSPALVSPQNPQRPVLRLLTKAELDEAELQTRLVLDHMGADSGEQIDLLRKARGIQIHGVVATEQRKHELQMGLRALAHVTSSIYSLDELDEVQSKSGARESPSRVSLRTVIAQPSPLQRYFTEHARSNDDLSRISQQLFDRALVVSQESKIIVDLRQRFTSGEPLGETARSVLGQLLTHHKAKLLGALDGEAGVVAEMGIQKALSVSDSDEPCCASPAATSTPDLDGYAGKNFALCKELISGREGPGKTAESIVALLSGALRELRAVASDLPVDLASLTKPGGRK